MGYLYGESLNTRSHTFAPLSDDAQIVAQWVELLFQTPLGFIWEAPEYGFDLRAYVLRGLSDNDLAVLPAQIRAAVGYDQRFASVEATAERTYTGGGAVRLKFSVEITPKGPAAVPFSLTGTADADKVSIVLRGT